MGDIALQQESRKLKPIYDALDTGSYKLAIQTCNKILKKQPSHEIVKSLKALALLRSNKIEESIALADEILMAKPTDETVLGIMSHVLKHLDRAAEIISMYENAFKKLPSNEDLGIQTFMAMIRVGGWKNAQVVAFKLFRTFKGPKFLFWSIMAAVLQAQNAGANGGPPATTDEAQTPMLLNLALRLISASPVPSHTTADHFVLHLTILRSLNRIEDAFELVNSEKGKALCETSLVVDELRREIYVSFGAEREEVTLSRQRLEKGDRNWVTFVSLIDSVFRLISKSSVTETLDVVTGGDSTPTSAHLDPQLTPKPVSKAPADDIKYTPHILIADTRNLLVSLAKQDGKTERGSHMGLLHLEKLARSLEGTDKQVPSTLLNLLMQYFEDFSDKACCFEDLKPYMADLQESPSSELADWLSFLRKSRSGLNQLTSLKDLQRVINIIKIQRYASTDAQSESGEVQVVMDCLKLYVEALSFGKDLAEKDLQPGDDLALIAVNALVSAWLISGKVIYLHQAQVIVEYGSKNSKQNYQFRVLAIRLYRLAGASSLSLDHYRLLDVKQVQTDTLSHLIISRASAFSLASHGDIGMMSECISASEIYQQNSNDTADMIVRAFQYEKYSQIVEFVEFEDRLDNSLQRDLTRLEYVRMKAATDKITLEGLLSELHELEFVLEKMHYDNRDFTVIPNYQRKGQQLAEQTEMGLTRGFQWLTVFLQLYIRAYSRACKVETLAATDLNVFRSSWLSEMTEEEKKFLGFSQILHDWIPAPVLGPREAPILPGDAASKPPIELPVHGPPPHVKHDGSEPLKVDASADAAIKFFEDSATEVNEAIKDGRLWWKVLHTATLAQEAFVLLQVTSLPWMSGSSKSKKSDQPIVQSLKTVKSRAAFHLKGIARSLIKLGEIEGTADRRKKFVDECSVLTSVAPALDHDYILNVAKSFTDSRKSMATGLGKGLQKLAESA